MPASHKSLADLPRVSAFAGKPCPVLTGLVQVYGSDIPFLRVEWEERLAVCEGFEWDSGNVEKILEQHHVTPAECEELFFNVSLVVASDEKLSANEERLYALGQSDSGRPMFVVFTIRGRLIRVISARDMSRKERRIYKSS
jgi:uncharacterized protein